MKNRLLILILTVAVAFSGMAGFSSYVRANTDWTGLYYYLWLLEPQSSEYI